MGKQERRRERQERNDKENEGSPDETVSQMAIIDSRRTPMAQVDSNRLEHLTTPKQKLDKDSNAKSAPGRCHLE